MQDVIIIGGSYAGIAAGLQLARARRDVLVLDAGERRNRFAKASHGFLGQDGQPPDVIAARGRAELLAYPTVSWRETLATDVRSIPGGFVVRANTEEYRARRLILATGMVDELPLIPGLAERWGRTVFFCPYCDGYEFDLGQLGVLARTAASVRFAILVSQWARAGGTTLFLNAAIEPEAAELADLEARRITVERELVVSAAGDAPGIELQLRDGRTRVLDGLFLMPRARQKTAFAEQLGCELEEGHLGPMYKIDAMKETTVAGVYACGDAALSVPSVAYAVADGTRAGTAVHQSLVFRPEL